jgi:hypothetical protein
VLLVSGSHRPVCDVVPHAHPRHGSSPKGPLHAAAQPALQHIGRSYLPSSHSFLALRRDRPDRGSPRASPRVWANACPRLPAALLRNSRHHVPGPPRPPTPPASFANVSTIALATVEATAAKPAAIPPDRAGHIMPLLTPPHASGDLSWPSQHDPCGIPRQNSGAELPQRASGTAVPVSSAEGSRCQRPGRASRMDPSTSDHYHS